MTKHAIERAKERIGLTITPEEMATITLLINGGNPLAVRLKFTHDGCSEYAVRFHGQWIPVVWKTGRVVTVLQIGRLGPYRKMLNARKKELIRSGRINHPIALK